MKILPCRFCSDGHAKLSKANPLDGNPREPNLYYADSYPGRAGGGSFSYKCLGCTHFSVITVMEYHALPEVRPEEYPASMVRQLVPDLTMGGAMKDHEAEDLLRSGLTLRDLIELDRSLERTPVPAPVVENRDVSPVSEIAPIPDTKPRAARRGK